MQLYRPATVETNTVRGQYLKEDFRTPSKGNRGSDPSEHGLRLKSNLNAVALPNLCFKLGVLVESAPCSSQSAGLVSRVLRVVHTLNLGLLHLLGLG